MSGQILSQLFCSTPRSLALGLSSFLLLKEVRALSKQTSELVVPDDECVVAR